MSELPALLRLGLAPGSLKLVRKHPLLTGLRGRRVSATLRLRDTPDRRFAAVGWLCLGIEDKAGLRHVMLPVAGQGSEDMPSLHDVELRDLASGSMTGTLLTLQRDGQSIELQMNAAKLQTDAQDTAYEELVLQGGADSTMLLTALAAELSLDLNLRWTGTAPVAAAAAALDVIEPQPMRAGAFEATLSEDMTAAAACAAILRQCLMQFDANMQPVLRDRDTEGVHQMRVALRRLRSALGLFSDMLDRDRLLPLIEDLRWLNNPLGRKRDLDVFLAETLNPLRSLASPPRGLQHLATVLDDRRAAAQEALASALLAPRTAAFRLGFAAFIDAVTAGSAIVAPEIAAIPAPRFAAELLRRRRKKLRKLGERHEELETEALHDLRIRAKKLRYAAEFFRPFFGRKQSRQFIAALAELQDSLGALNDASMGTRLIANVLATPDTDPAAAAIAAWFAGRQQLQLDHLGDAWDAFDDIRPFWKDALED